jgi:protein SCO1/2
MKTILAILICMCAAVTAGASSVPDSTLRTIRFDQKINSRVSLDLPFRDENGATVKLGKYFGGKPVILVPGYYGCPMLCTLVLNGLIGTLQDLRASVGDQFQVVNFSIDPDETSALAAAKKRSALRAYGRPGAAQGWAFLTGNAASDKELAGEIGFHYLYDPTIKQYAHPSGFVVLTPEGKIERYFFGVDYEASELDKALTAASANQSGSTVRELFLLCFCYSPLTGKYAPLIMDTVRTGGILTLVALALVIGRSIRRDHPRNA